MHTKILLNYVFAVCVTFLAGLSTALANNNEWLPVTGAETLRDFISGLKAERTLPNGEISRGEYRADGTGTLNMPESANDPDNNFMTPFPRGNLSGLNMLPHAGRKTVTDHCEKP